MRERPTKLQDYNHKYDRGLIRRQSYSQGCQDKEHCEEYGRMLNADPSVVSTRAKKRGLPQLGTLGAGNHYAEIQVRGES